jgi:hypothetical protein
VATPLGVVVGKTLPQGDVEQLTDQFTPFDAGSLPTVAVTCTLAFGSRVVWPGVLTETQIGSEIVTFTVPEMAGLLTDVAVIVTVNPDELTGPGAL